jgi:hypothetical protein
VPWSKLLRQPVSTFKYLGARVNPINATEKEMKELLLETSN